MHPYIVRALRTATIAAVVVLAACGDKEVGSSKLKSLKPGDTHETVLKTIGTGPLTAAGSDTARLDHGFRQMQYFANGHQFQVIYFREALGTVTEAVDQKVETPIVLMDDKVIGAGWAFYVDAMKQYNLPTPLVAKDTTTKPKPDSAPTAPKQVTKDPTKMLETPDSLKKKM